MMDKLISQQAAIDKIKKRLFETAFNNVGIKQNIDETLVDVAENRLENWFDELPSIQPEPCGDAVSRNAIVQKLNQMDRYVSTELRLCDTDKKFPQNEVFIVDDVYEGIVEQLPSVQPDLGKYEYHYDHTDCIWYRPEARNRCPVTCAQYRDGWNDAMNYIFRGGKGYRPYRRGEQYEE